MGKCPYCPHGSGSAAASSRMSECTPELFPFLGNFRTHTHHLGAHGGKQRRAQLEEREWRPAYPRWRPRSGAPLTSHDCPSVPASQLDLKCS
jgi:hypothetical protein